MQGVKVKSNQTNKYSSKVQIPKEYTEVHSQSNCTLLLPTSEESRLKKTNLPQNGSNKVEKRKHQEVLRESSLSTSERSPPAESAFSVVRELTLSERV